MGLSLYLYIELKPHFCLHIIAIKHLNVTITKLNVIKLVEMPPFIFDLCFSELRMKIGGINENPIINYHSHNYFNRL